VYEEQGYYKCFGCGAKGDAFVYWQRSRHCEFAEALKQLAKLANLPLGASNSPLHAGAKQRCAQQLARLMTGVDLAPWMEAVERLRANDAMKKRIAAVRGYDVRTVAWAAEKALMGLPTAFELRREAFAVHRPIGVPVGYHVCLEPYTRGNGCGRNPSWRFVPIEVEPWPFIIGNPETARMLFVTQGEWNALALIDCLFTQPDGGKADHEFVNLPAEVAVVGLRGITSWKGLVKYTWDREAIMFVIGNKLQTEWLGDEGLTDLLWKRCDRVHCFLGDRDFSDLWKAGLVDRDRLAGAFARQLRCGRLRGRPKMGPTFLQFCRLNRRRKDEIGEIARRIIADPQRLTGRKPLRVWEQQYLTRYVPQEHHAAFYHAWREFVAL
jgi:hypothetical protein